MNINVKEAFDEYNVLWTTQSTTSKNSMPVGGYYNCGYSVQVENNEILLYLSKEFRRRFKLWIEDNTFLNFYTLMEI